MKKRDRHTQMQSYYQKNRETLKEKKRIKYAENREAEIEKMRAYREKNHDVILARRRAAVTEETKAANRAYHRAHKEQQRAYHLQRAYRLTPEQAEQMKAAQGYRCTCCGCRPKKWHVDHDHATGRVRAYLCSDCNNALVYLRERVERARAMVKYILRYCKQTKEMKPADLPLDNQAPFGAKQTPSGEKVR